MNRSLPLFLALVACGPPDLGQGFNQISVQVGDGDEAADAFVAAIDGAKDAVHAAFPSGEDPRVAEALVDAWERGLDVEVVTDIDQLTDPGVVALLDAEVPLRLADGGIAYFDFNVNDDVAWASGQTIMSHAYVVTDRRSFVSATDVGYLAAGNRVWFEVEGEELIEDMLTEHNQVFGGADATSTTSFDGLAKSIADARWRYNTQGSWGVQLWFGPQERLIKRVIDAAYNARANVWVLTNDFANAGLAEALQTKAEWGFDVKVVTGPKLGASSAALTAVLRNETPDVPKFQVTEDRRVPTVVLVDTEEARDGNHYPARAYVISHDLYSATRLHRGIEVINDQLIDGALWVIEDDVGDLEPELESLIDLFNAHLDLAEEL